MKGYPKKGPRGSEVYYFPSLILEAGQSVKVYTNQGTYSFGSGRAIWTNSGETAYLYDPNGEVVSEWGW